MLARSLPPSPTARFLAFAAALLLPGLAPSGAEAAGKKTHLGVAPNQIVNVRTFQLTNNNQPDAFFYDRGQAEFFVPEGQSFVVTDIIVEPSVTVPDPANHVFVFINAGPTAARSFPVNYLGGEVRHYPLAGALVMQGGFTPSARNTGLSNVGCEVQLIGYFIKAPALPELQPAFPAPVN